MAECSSIINAMLIIGFISKKLSRKLVLNEFINLFLQSYFQNTQKQLKSEKYKNLETCKTFTKNFVQNKMSIHSLYKEILKLKTAV